MGTAALSAAKLKVMALVPYVQKGSSPGLKYSFASEAAFIEKLHPAMIEAGLEIAPEEMAVLHQEVYATNSGAKMNRILVSVKYRLTHAGSGESQVIHTIGEGADGGDKATNKAMTAAYKYALRQAFLIETGNDPDETPSDQQQRASRGRPNHPSGPRPAGPAADGRKEVPLTLSDLRAGWLAFDPADGKAFFAGLAKLDWRLQEPTGAKGYFPGDVAEGLRNGMGWAEDFDAGQMSREQVIAGKKWVADYLAKCEPKAKG